MRRYKISHETIYAFSGDVQFLPHTLRLRPRESHELRIENSGLNISPAATIRWYRDVEGNSVATASFIEDSNKLIIKSEVVISHYDEIPHNFLVADHAVDYPFEYEEEEKVLLLPYMLSSFVVNNKSLTDWVRDLWHPNEKITTVGLLFRLNQRIFQMVDYCRREEEGVQQPEFTIAARSGSCRDSAYLFMAASRQLGLASRFVSGYLYSKYTTPQSGATHAWAEVFIPGAGWKGFDPTLGAIVGAEHIPVAVARMPESVPPIEGKFLGSSSAEMNVTVSVVEI